MDTTLTNVVESAMARHHVPGMSIAITGPDGVIAAAGFGRADLVRSVPATESTQYLWFSMTKIATATAAMRLSDLGMLDLDGPASAFVPELRSHAGVSPTVRQLLSHTAGLANPLPIRWVHPADRPAPPQRELVDALLARRRIHRHPVGGAARYSNVGYLILAEVIAQATGRPFTEYVTDEILRPLGMTDTGFTYAPSGEAAVGYVRAPRPATPLIRWLLPSGIAGDRVDGHLALNRFLVDGAGYGGLVGPVTDAARLAALHLADGSLDGHEILRPDTARLMRTIAAPGKPFDLGLGWFRKPTDRGTKAVEHLGAGGGFFNAMRLYPDRGLGIVAMANTTTAYDHATLFDAIASLPWTAREGLERPRERAVSL